MLTNDPRVEVYENAGHLRSFLDAPVAAKAA